MVGFNGIRRRSNGDIEYKLRVSGGNYVECVSANMSGLVYKLD